MRKYFAYSFPKFTFDLIDFACDEVENNIHKAFNNEFDTKDRTDTKFEKYYDENFDEFFKEYAKSIPVLDIAAEDVEHLVDEANMNIEEKFFTYVERVCSAEDYNQFSKLEIRPYYDDRIYFSGDFSPIVIEYGLGFRDDRKRISVIADEVKYYEYVSESVGEYLQDIIVEEINKLIRQLKTYRVYVV